MRRTDTHLYFWGSVFSNWARTPLHGSVAYAELVRIATDEEIALPDVDPITTGKLSGFRYNCNEQWMMAVKAWLFGDADGLDAIQRSRDPRAQKAMGQAVRPFVPAVWDRVRVAAVTAGAVAKFGHDQRMTDELLDTGDLILVEGSSSDRIWGVGIDWRDDAILDIRNWRGLNLLGKALMAARAILAARRSA